MVDFGVLSRPEDEFEDDFRDVAYTVELKELNNLDGDYQQVSVYVRDQNASVNGDQKFYLTNKADSSKKFEYNLFDQSPSEITETSVSINEGKSFTAAAGYYLVGFTVAGEAINGTLRLNQKQICDYDITEIVGDYSGYMVFFSMVEDQD